MVSAEVVIAGGHKTSIDRLSCGFAPERTIESSLDQTLRAQSGGIAGIQFLSALRAVCHLRHRGHFMRFARTL